MRDGSRTNHVLQNLDDIISKSVCSESQEDAQGVAAISMRR